MRVRQRGKSTETRSSRARDPFWRNRRSFALSLLTALAFGVLLSGSVTASHGTVTVNSTGNAVDNNIGDGVCWTGANNSASAPECTFRAAIAETNVSASVDVINFNMPTSELGHAGGVWTIGVFSATLPSVGAQTDLDATTQPGYAGTPIVEVDGAGLSPGDDGLMLNTGSDGSIIRGFSVINFPDDGIWTDANDTIIAGNYVGLRADGTTLGPNRDGIVVWNGAQRTQVGGAGTDRNIVSGNNVSGVIVTGLVTADTNIDGNYVGTDPTGLSPVGNGGFGIQVLQATGTAIGSTVPNIVGASAWSGLLVDGAADQTTVTNNFIGIGSNSTADVGNAVDGIRVTGDATNTLIGRVGEGNVIGHNLDDGVEVDSSGTGTRVEYNLIGVSASGLDLGNAEDGVKMDNMAVASTVSQNTVAFNGFAGIVLEATVTGVVALEMNLLHDNVELGIDLADDGPTPNDPDDVDVGPNGLLNFPRIAGFTETSPGVHTIDYYLDVPAGSYDVHFFANPSGVDPSGYGEAEQWIGSHSITSTGLLEDGYTSGDIAMSLGTVVTAHAVATADLAGSELSAPQTVAAPATVVVNSTADTSDSNIGDGVCYTGTTNAVGANECTLRAAIEEVNATASVINVDFNIPVADAGHSGGVWTFVPLTEYQYITSTIMLDATTQPGFTGTPIIELDGGGGGAPPPASAAFMIHSSNSLVRGFIVHSWFDEGLEIGGFYSFGDNNTLAGNWIGIDRAGTPMPNGDNGILITGAADGNTIGGTAAGDANIVGASTSEGIEVRLGADGNTLLGNYIGVLADGVTPVPNGLDGVVVFQTATNTTIGSPAAPNIIRSNVGAGINIEADVGAGTVVEGNEIALHGTAGVAVVGTVDAAIVGNSIHSNVGLGIDLGNDGVTLNDVGDGDTGPNGLLNHPVITTIAQAGGDLVVDYSLDAPAESYRIDFFANPSGADPSGSGEGETYLASTTISHPGGSASYSHAFAAAPSEITMSATAEPVAGNRATSEFSAADTVSIFLYDLSGSVLEDVDGDGNIGDGVGADAVDVHLYVDAGIIGEPDAADPLRLSTVTAPDGSFTFDNVLTGNYWVVVDSLDVAPTLGFVSGHGQPEVWAEQTHGPAGSAYFIGGLPATTVSAGPLFGGRDPAASDIAGSAATAEHAALVNLTNDLIGVDFGFSFETIASTNDVDQGSLRQFMANSNAVSLMQKSHFEVPTTDSNHAAGVWTISPVTPLPTMIDPIDLDATNQSGYVGSPVIHLDGAATPAGIGLNFAGASSIMRAFAITSFTGDGVAAVADLLLLEDNHIGVTPSGSASGNSGDGVYIFGATDVTINANTIGSNGTDGVRLHGTTNASVTANIIGLDPTATFNRGNVNSGIYITGGSASTLIGGVAVDENVISGNGINGISIADATLTTITENLIGVADDGFTDRGNAGDGISVEGATPGAITGVTIDSNVIAGNTVVGIDLRQADGVTIVGNSIGTDTRGSLAIPNLTGVFASLDVQNSIVGGTVAGDGNLIAHNLADGVALANLATELSILGNAIYGNGELGIDLSNDGPTANDLGDGDSGPNGLLNTPIVTAALTAGPNIDITYDLDVTAGTYRIEFFRNPAGTDAPQTGEGEQFAGFDLVVHPGGSLTYNASVPSGVGDITATTTDASSGYAATSEFSLAQSVNGPPVVTNPGNQTDPEGVPLGLAIIGNDPDLDPLTWSTTGLPAGLSINPGTGIITGTIAYTEAGIHAVSVTATDPGTLFDTVNFTWTVNNVNRSPTVTNPGNQTDPEGALISLPIVGSDPDLDTITWTATGLPPGLTINSGTGEIAGTIGFGAAGLHNVLVTATDDGTPTLDDTANFTWDVTNTNRDPVLDPVGDQTIDEQTLLAFTATGTDPDLDNLTFTLTGEPTGAAITPTGDFTFIPTETQGPGPYTFDVIITDDGTPNLTDTETITITVTETNITPTVTNPGTQTDPEGATISLPIVAVDPDIPVNTITWTATGLPPGLSINPTTGEITGTLPFSSAGNYPTAQATAFDGTNSAAVVFTWDVTNTNRAPVLDPVGDQTIDEQTLLAFTATGTDPDLDNLTFTLTGEPTGAAITPTGDFTFIPTETQGPGPYTFDVIITDDGTPNLTDTETITITVTETNITPTVTNPGTQTDPEGATISLPIVAVDPDIPVNTITWTATGLPPGLSINPTTGEITGTLPFTAAGNYPTAQATATDDGTPTLDDTANFTWNVTVVATTTTTTTPTTTTTTTPTTTTTTSPTTTSTTTTADSSSTTTTGSLSTGPTTTAPSSEPPTTKAQTSPTNTVPDAIPFTGLVAEPDMFTARESSITIDVLRNDSLGDDGVLASIQQPLVGEARIEGNVVVVDIPAGFGGDVTFEYTIANSRGKSSTAIVTVVAANILTSDSLAPPEQPISSLADVFRRFAALVLRVLTIDLSTLQLTALLAAPVLIFLLRQWITDRDYLASVTGTSLHSDAATRDGDNAAAFKLRHDALVWIRRRRGRTCDGERQIEVETPAGRRWIDVDSITDTGF